MIYTMRETSLKLSWLFFILVAFATFLSPLGAEARQKPKEDKNCHQPVKPSPVPPTEAPSPTPYEGIDGDCGSPCMDDNDCNYPCPRCSSANKTCTYDLPYLMTPPPSPSPTPPPHIIRGECGSPCVDENDCTYPCWNCFNKTCNYPYYMTTPPSPSPTPQIPPTLAPNSGIDVPPPYQIPHGGCGSPCSDSNDCDGPCTLCCWQNQTCCHEEPFLTLPSPLPPPSPIVASPAPDNGVGVPSYQTHGCGYPCSDSNDCDWPCTLCCANQTCCYEIPYPTIPTSPLQQPPSPSPSPSLSPSPSANDDDDDEQESNGELPPTPSYYASLGASSYKEYPPYQVHGCGHPCKDSNNCDWPCTNCCGNHTCCYDDQLDWPPPNVFG